MKTLTIINDDGSRIKLKEGDRVKYYFNENDRICTGIVKHDLAGNNDLYNNKTGGWYLKWGKNKYCFIYKRKTNCFKEIYHIWGYKIVKDRK